jgi:predicted nucleic acid-binding Zn ribbon protein
VPAYDYVCEGSAAHVYTETRSINETQKVLVCPTEGCGAHLNRIWTSNPVVLNGKGFYSTDSRSELLKPGQQVDW